MAVRPGTRLRLRGATHLDRPWEMPTCFVALGASFTTQMAHKNSQAPHFTLMFTPGKAPNSSRSMAHSKVGMASPVVLSAHAIFKEIGQKWPQNLKIFLASQGRRSQDAPFLPISAINATLYRSITPRCALADAVHASFVRVPCDDSQGHFGHGA